MSDLLPPLFLNRTTENANEKKCQKKLDCKFLINSYGVFANNLNNFHLISSLLWSQDCSLNTWLSKSIWSDKENLFSIWTVKLQSPQICPVLIWKQNLLNVLVETKRRNSKYNQHFTLNLVHLFCAEQNTTLPCVTSCSSIFAWNGVWPTVYIN